MPADAPTSTCVACALRAALQDSIDPDLPKNHSSANPQEQQRFFGNYELLGEVARGGMGVVYRARQLGLKRIVALKTIHTSAVPSLESHNRFQREIEAVARLHHPNIVPLYDVGQHNGADFFTMRLVEEGSLATQPLDSRPTRDWVRLLLKICHAIHYAHEQGILHRDLKPSNILIDSQGEPLVADFGIAKVIDDEQSFTRTSTILGSPNFMAPEQAAGRSNAISRATDTYGLGSLLYYLLTGRSPFQAESELATLRLVLDQPPTPPSNLYPCVDPTLESICLKCLHKDPLARFPTAQLLALELEQWLAGVPTPFPSVHPQPSPPVSLPPRPSWATTLAVTAGGFVLLIAIATAAWVTVQNHRRLVDQRRESLLAALDDERTRSELVGRSAALDQIRDIARLARTGSQRWVARNALLSHLARAELRFVPFSNAFGSETRPQFLLNSEFTQGVSLSATQPFAVYSIPDFQPVPTPSLSRLFEGVSNLEQLSATGRYLGVRSSNAWHILDLIHDRAVGTFTNALGPVSFDRAEKTAFLQLGPDQAAFIDLSTGGERRWTARARRPGGRPSGWHAASLSPEGRLLAAYSRDSRIIELLNSTNGTQVRLLTNAHLPTATPAWSREGGWLAVGGADRTVSIWLASRGTHVATSPPLPSPLLSLSFSPDGDWLLANTADGKTRLFEIRSRRWIHEMGSAPHRTHFSASGAQIGPIEVGGRLGCIEIDPPSGVSGIKFRSTHVNALQARFRSDGRLLASGDTLNVVFCDADSRQEIALAPGISIDAFDFHPKSPLALFAGPNGIFRAELPSSPGSPLASSTHNLLLSGRGWRSIQFRTDGAQWVGVNTRSNAAFVFDATLTNSFAELGPHLGISSASISADGRWVSTASETENTVRIWDLVSRTEHLKIPVNGVPHATFDATGRWFAVWGDTLQLLHPGSWTRVPWPSPLSRQGPFTSTSVQPVAVAFSADGRQLAVADSANQVHWCDLETQEHLTILRPPPAHQLLHGLTFDPAGRRLIAGAADSRLIIWDLDTLRRRLAEFSLGLPPPSAKPPSAN